MGNLPASATEASLKELFDTFAGSEVRAQPSSLAVFCCMSTKSTLALRDLSEAGAGTEADSEAEAGAKPEAEVEHFCLVLTAAWVSRSMPGLPCPGQIALLPSFPRYIMR